MTEKGIKVMGVKDARLSALHGRVTVVGHGEYVADDGEVVKVALVTEVTMKGYENLNDAEIAEYDTLLDAAMYGEPMTDKERARLEELFAKVRGG